MFRVDLNCDLGESFGVYKLGRDEEIMTYITSANVACGFHAGDPQVMRRTVIAALNRGVAVGAHPGLPDLTGFGRRWLEVTPEEVYAIVVYQIGALAAFLRAEGGRMQHVKPHGALYNRAAVDRRLAEAIAEAVYRVDPELILFAPWGSELQKAGEAAGLRVAAEVFADRAYRADGTLLSRGEEGAVIADPEEAARRAVSMVKEGKIMAVTGEAIPVRADTICLHGDSPGALAAARRIRESLQEAGIEIKAVGKK